MANYNVIVFGNLHTTMEVEGRTYVGGNITSGSTQQFGIHMTSVAANDRVLVVAGDILGGADLKVHHGSLIKSTTSTISPSRNVLLLQAGATLATEAINNSYAQTRYINAANYYKSLASNSTVSTPTNGQPGPVNFNVAHALTGTAVFNVDASQIFHANVQQYGVNGWTSNVTDIIINVSGTTINFSNGNFTGMLANASNAGKILWNFYEATSITLNSQFIGSILAPYADITAQSLMTGSIVANSITTTAEIHLPTGGDRTPYDGPTPPEAVPEPSTNALLLLAGAGLWLLHRRRTAVAA